MIEEKITSSLIKATEVDNVLLSTPRGNFGDYATNIALILAKKEDKNPKDVAGEIIKKLNQEKYLKKYISRIEVAGVGFINFYLSEKYLEDNLKKVIDEGDDYAKSDVGKGKTVVIDYSSPNIAKHFGIGHLRSTIIGQALYNLLSYQGYKVIGDNHLGDWGTQFGMILAQIKEDGLDVKELSVDELEELYIKFNKRMDEDPKLRDEAKLWFKKLEDGDKEAREIWESVVETSKKEFDRVYTLLGVKIDYAHGESFYEDKMEDVINEAKEKGIAKKSQGAEVIDFKDMVPGLLVKSDGTTTYLTRDLATIKFRIDEWDPHIFIYEVGSEQRFYFKQVFEAARLLGWAKSREFVHVPHGLIRFEHGKMSTRKGQTIKLEEVLNEAIKRAKEIVEKSETGKDLEESEMDEISEKVGIGAVKYFDLLHHPQSDIIFDWDKAFVLEGNSSPYIQYTIARINSVISKSGGEVKATSFDKISLDPEELLLMRYLSRFPGVIHDAAKNYSPNLLTNYIFDLAQKFNSFYNSQRIIGSEKEEFRLALTKAVGIVLKNGLKLLGIGSPERM